MAFSAFLSMMLPILGMLTGFKIYQNVTTGEALLFAVLGGLLLGFCYLTFTSVFGGKVWGIRIKGSTLSTIKKIGSAIGLYVGGIFLILTFIGIMGKLTSRFVANLIIVALFVGFLLLGAFLAKVINEKMLARENTCEVLGQFELFRAVDANLPQAVNFVVGFEGVALFSQTNYCFAVFRYNDYRLGELSSPQEVALVGTYFIQKYSEQFTFKVDMEVIPGEPGQTVVAVGTGGIGVARIQGTPDKRIFRSYIFTRKK